MLKPLQKNESFSLTFTVITAFCATAVIVWTAAAVTACCAAPATAEITDEAVFFPKNVNEHFVSESLGAEVHSTGVGFIEAYGHDPCSQEGKPSDGDHYPDLELCQHMGEAMDVNKPHVRGHTCQSCYCQPAKKDFCWLLNIKHKDESYPKFREVIIRK